MKHFSILDVGSDDMFLFRKVIAFVDRASGSGLVRRPTEAMAIANIFNPGLEADGCYMGETTGRDSKILRCIRNLLEDASA